MKGWYLLLLLATFYENKIKMDEVIQLTDVKAEGGSNQTTYGHKTSAHLIHTVSARSLFAQLIPIFRRFFFSVDGLAEKRCYFSIVWLGARLSHRNVFLF